MRLSAALVLLPLLGGCPDGGGGPSAPDTTGGDTTVTPEATEGDGGGDGSTPGDGTTGDATPDATGTDATPDGAGKDDITGDAAPPGPDGLLGSPCTSDAECKTDGVCLSGMCTWSCKDDQGAPIVNGCAEVSKVSVAGPKFGCPADVGWCVPGYVDGKNVKCSADADCAAFGKGIVCATAILFSSKVVDGICIPAGDRKVIGSTCEEPFECQALLCHGPSSGPQTCGAHCKQNSNCPTQYLCVGVGFTSSEQPDPIAYGGLCRQFPGSLAFCKNQAGCPSGEVCEVFVEPASFGPFYWCTTGNAGGKALGEKCTASADCFAGACLFGNQANAGIDGYCAQTCQAAEDCAADATLRCGQLPLHANTTSDDPTDDPQYGMCVRGALDDACSVGAPGWCEAGLWCKPDDTLPEGIGSCAAPACDDKIKNGTETDVDCGGGACPGCAADLACGAATDCASGFCKKKAGKKICGACATDGDCAALDAKAVCKAGTCELPPPAPEPKWCAEVCTKDDDCTAGTTCKDSACVGGGPEPMCTADADCAALFSGWTTSCTDDAGCPGQVCIEDAGGKCAMPPSEFVKCDTIGMSDYATKKKADGSEVTVCANTSYTCKSGFCGCKSDASCTAGTPYCNAEIGACHECKADTDCAGKAMPKCLAGYCAGCATDADCKSGLSKCQADSTCGCASDDECKATNADTCYDGTCGCASVDSCSGNKAHPGTTWQCLAIPD